MMLYLHAGRRQGLHGNPTAYYWKRFHAGMNLLYQNNNVKLCEYIDTNMRRFSQFDNFSICNRISLISTFRAELIVLRFFSYGNYEAKTAFC